MPSYAFETYDVFTDTPFTGNQLAVILSAAGLSDAAMQSITREFNLSETVFVLPPADPRHDARLRIFTPGYEMAFAGHPTVGAAIAIAGARKIDGALSLELKAGLFPVDIDRQGAAPFAAFVNPNLPQEIGPAPPSEALEAALFLPAGSIHQGRAGPRLISAGTAFVYARAPLAAVRTAQVNSAAFEALAFEETVGLFLYAEGGDGPGADYHARMFAPGAGIAEDAATGSACAALPGHIALANDMADGDYAWNIEQGVEMGRPSRISADISIAGGAIRRVRIGGHAVLMQRGEIFI